MAHDDGSMTVDRRQFMKTTGAAALGLSTLAKRSVAGTAANGRLVAGCIGVGGQGGGLMSRLLSWASEENVTVAATCDVWAKRRAYWMARGDCEGYRDYRRLLERKDIDCVTIGTPDHWHAQISIDAMEAGKDVYCEKPMTLTWEEAKAVAAVAKRTGRVYQCGAQSASTGRFHDANVAIRQGAIGKLIWSQGSYCRNNRGGDWNYNIDRDANPGNLDWDLWLGPAPKRPWSPERYFRFRKFWDYSGGVATDLLYHTLAHMQVALTPEFPLEVSAIGGNYIHAEREVPDTFHVLIKYPSNHTVFLVSTQENNTGVDETIRGRYGTLSYQRGGAFVQPQHDGAARAAHGPLAHAQAVTDDKGNTSGYLFGGTPDRDHLRNWLDAIRGTDKLTLPADPAYKVMVAIHLAVLSYREGKVKRFDPIREEVVA